MALVKRVFDRDGDKIFMRSTYDHSDIFRDNYKQRMSGDKGYVDKEKDFMRVARIPIAFLASLSNEEKVELESNPAAIIKLLDEHPEFRTNTARL